MATASRWNELGTALRELHRALLERARGDYLRENLITGDVGPGELLRLLTADPYFEWLRSLSELMVDIDLLAEEAATAAHDDTAAAVRAAVEFFVTPPASAEAPHPFAQRYWPYVQDSPHVAMAHAAVKRALAEWPAPEMRDRASLLKHRRWVAERAHERKPSSSST